MSFKLHKYLFAIHIVQMRKENPWEAVTFPNLYPWKSWYSSPSHIQASKALFYTAQLEPLTFSPFHSPQPTPTPA